MDEGAGSPNARRYTRPVIRDQILGTSGGYRAFRRLIKADRSMQVIVDEYVKPTAGCSVLDIGCGNADLADLFRTASPTLDSTTTLGTSRVRSSVGSMSSRPTWTSWAALATSHSTSL